MIEFRLLGSVDLKGSEGETLRSVLAQPKRVALLAYLAVARPNGFHRRDKLLGLFWPESDQERGRGSLRKAIYLLRQSLGEEVIVSRGDEEIGLAEGALWCDAVAFEAALDVGEPERALELYRGHLLDGFYIAEAPEFERWVDGERERLCARASEAAWALADEAEGMGNGVEVAKWARKAVSFSPDDEAALRRLLELLDRLGDRTGAIKEYEGFARRSREEYEADPSPETQALIAAIREREVAAAGGGAEQPVEGRAGEARAVSPEAVRSTPGPEPGAEPRPVSLLRVLTTYALVSLAVLVAVHIFTLQLGLPGWFFPSAVVVLLACLPIIVATALVQGARFSARPAGSEASRPSVAAQSWLTWRNAVGLMVVALAVLGLAVGGYMAMRVLGVGPWGTLIAKGVLEERDVIVLADFDEHTGDSILALTVTDLMSVGLDQSSAVRIADRDYVNRVLQRMEKEPNTPLTYDLAREVAIREGLKAVVTGAINLAGSSYALTVRLVAAESGEVLFSDREVAMSPDAIISATTLLSGRLRERIGESLKAVRASPPLRELRTASLEALRLQTEARRANRRGDFSRAVDLNSRAIEIDTSFATAYLGRAINLWNLGIEPAQQIADTKRAYELRHRLPLWQQCMVEAEYHGTITGNREKAIEALRSAVELKPDYSGAINSLGLAYRQLGDFAHAEEMFRRLIDIDSLIPHPWGHLAVTQFNQGKFDEAWETLRRWEAIMPDYPTIPRRRAEFASAQGDYDSARTHLRRRRDLLRERLLAQASFNADMGRLAQVQGKSAEAEGHFLAALALYEERQQPLYYLLTAVQLAGLQVFLPGDTIRALETVAAAVEKYPLDPTDPLEYAALAIAGFYALAGEPERAREELVDWEEAVSEWETVVAPDSRRRLELQRRNQWGAVALAEGRVDDALVDLRWVQEQCLTCGLPLLAQAHELAGRPDSAVVLYEQYLTTPNSSKTLGGFSPTGSGEPFWLPVVYERLGDLYEQRGDTAKAVYYYGKFVDLWKDADPELQPRVEAARRAIDALSPDT
jgi:DNA-binding SARP family transcriptional activator